MATLRTSHNVESSTLLFEARPRENFIASFWLSMRYTTPPTPPGSYSPWLDPSKNPHGHVLFISGAIIGRFGFDLDSVWCSINFYISIVSVISVGVNVFWNTTLFLASQIVNKKESREGFMGTYHVIVPPVLTSLFKRRVLTWIWRMIKFVGGSYPNCSCIGTWEEKMSICLIFRFA